MFVLKLKWEIDFANKERIPYVIVMGEDEILNKKIEVKGMIDYTSEVISLEEIDEIVKVIK